MTDLQTERLTPIAAARGWNMGRRASRRAEAGIEDLGPQGIGAVMDRGFGVLRAHFGLLIGVSLCISLPFRIYEFMVLKNTSELSWDMVYSVGIATSSTLLVTAICARALGDYVAGGEVTLASLLRFSLGEVFGLVLLCALVGGAAMMGLFFVFVGALVVVWLLALAPTVYVLERERGPLGRIGYAMSRSMALAAGGFWRWSAVIVVVYGIYMGLGFPLELLEDPQRRVEWALKSGMAIEKFDWAVCILGGVFQGLFACLLGVVYGSYYLDQRARLEGVDLYVSLAGVERSAERRDG